MPNLFRSLFKPALYCLALLLVLFGVLAAVLLLFPAPDFERHAPRDLPWVLPDHSQAFKHVEVLSNGQLHIKIEHPILTGISPAMVSFFYQVLPISRVALNGVEMPMYHIFHPTEHGYIEVKQAAASGKAGMTRGAVIERREWFGDYNSKGSGRIIEMNDEIMRVRTEMFGLNFGEMTHRFEMAASGTSTSATSGTSTSTSASALIGTSIGTRYTVETFIGSDLPVLGPLINRYIRYKMFPPAMVEQWLRHQLEEVSSLQFFLAELYQQRHNKTNHYTLNINPAD